MKINFTLFKNEKKEGNQPDYRISMKVGEEYKNVGGGWLKEGSKGVYISCKIDDEYKKQDSLGPKDSAVPF